MPTSWKNAPRFPGDAAAGRMMGLKAPWVAVVNSYGYAGIAGITTSPATYKRYGLIISANPNVNPATLRAVAPDAILLFYLNATQVQVNTVTLGAPITTGLAVYPGHWLTNAGTLSTSSLGSGGTSLICGVPITAFPATPFPILVTSPDKTLYEVMVVTAVSLSGSTNTLTVTRGNWNSVSTNVFGVGSRVAAIANVSNFATSFQCNTTPYCPKNGSNQRWSDYLATFVQTQLASFPDYDGVFLDSCNTYLNPSVNNADADGNNQVDQVGGDGPSPGGNVYNSANAFVMATPAKGTYYGLTNLLTKLRGLTSNAPAVILTNGNGYPLMTDGMYHEDFLTTSFGFAPPFNSAHKMQFALAQNALDETRYPVSLLNPILIASASAVTGTTVNVYAHNAASFTKMRFGLAAAHMAGCFSAFDWTTLFHGQTWWMDEHYNAQGSALSADVASSSGAGITIPVVQLSKFAVSDVIRVPNAVVGPTSAYVSNCEDETMTVTAKQFSSGAGNLTCTRSNTVTAAKLANTAVFTDAHVTSGLGWLGKSRAAAVSNIGALSTIGTVANAGFETSSPSAGGAFAVATFTSWTLNANTNAGNFPAAALYYADGRNPHGGSQCLMVAVTAPTIAAGSFTYFNVKVLQTVALTVVNGSPYTVSFWARGDRHQVMSLRVLNQLNNATYNSQQFYMAPFWTRYWIVTYPNNSDTGLTLQFEFSGDSGNYWLDDVAIYNGDANIWYRDFDNGLIVLNGTNNDLSAAANGPWLLPAVTNSGGTAYTTYKRINGDQQPAINTGATQAPGATIAVAAQDAIFLVKA